MEERLRLVMGVEERALLVREVLGERLRLVMGVEERVLLVREVLEERLGLTMGVVWRRAAALWLPGVIQLIRATEEAKEEMRGQWQGRRRERKEEMRG